MSDTTMQETGFPGRPIGVTTTIELLERFKKGDQEAVSILVERSIPPLKRWARGRLPLWARSLAETQDLVQNAVLRALPHLKSFEGLTTRRAPGLSATGGQQPHPGRDSESGGSCSRRARLGQSTGRRTIAPLERAIGQESLERYEAALGGCGQWIAKQLLPASNCSRATTRSRSLSAGRPPMRPVWPSSGPSGVFSRRCGRALAVPASRTPNDSSAAGAALDEA